MNEDKGPARVRGPANLGVGARFADPGFTEECRTVGLINAPQPGSISPALFFGESSGRASVAGDGPSPRPVGQVAPPIEHDNTRHEYIPGSSRR